MPPGTTGLISATGIPALPHWIPAPVAIAVLVAVALSAAWPLRRHFRKPSAGQRRGTAAVRVAAVAAIGCTAYSAHTSWRFAADYLDMGSSIERAAMFAAAELALFSTALLARANLNGPKQAPGLPGTLTWVITGVQIVPAYTQVVRAHVQQGVAGSGPHAPAEVGQGVADPLGKHAVVARQVARGDPVHRVRRIGTG